MRRWYPMLTAVIVSTALLIYYDDVWAQDDNPPKSSQNSAQQTPSIDDQQVTHGYPARKRRIGGPTDVEWDLDDSFPKQGSLLELILQCPEGRDQDP
ncbi:MAG: hypothetical protein PVG74_21865 [Desulfobacterales bacterium]